MDEATRKSSEWAASGAAKNQGRKKWIDSKAKQGHSKSLMKHIISHHLDAEEPCTCGYSEQEIIDMMDWSNPTRNAFYYAGPYRQYPRLIKRTLHLDHSRYARMIAGFKPLTEVLGFFSESGAVMDFDEFETILNKRFGSGESFWKSEDMRQFLFDRDKSSRTGMKNRWRKCAFLKPIADNLDIAHVMLG